MAAYLVGGHVFMFHQSTVTSANIRTQPTAKNSWKLAKSCNALNEEERRDVGLHACCQNGRLSTWQ